MMGYHAQQQAGTAAQTLAGWEPFADDRQEARSPANREKECTKEGEELPARQRAHLEPC